MVDLAYPVSAEPSGIAAASAAEGRAADTTVVEAVCRIAAVEDTEAAAGIEAAAADSPFVAGTASVPAAPPSEASGRSM